MRNRLTAICFFASCAASTPALGQTAPRPDLSTPLGSPEGNQERPVPPRSKTTLVQLDADRAGVSLERWDVPSRANYFDGEWETVCVAPCNRMLSVDAKYRIGGRGLVRSRPFILPEYAPAVTLTASTSTKASRVGGIIIVSVGGSALMGGLMVLWLDTLLSEGPNDEGMQGPSRSSLDSMGAALVLGGAIAVVAGVVMIVSSRTSVAVTPGSQSAIPSTKLFGSFELGPHGIAF